MSLCRIPALSRSPFYAVRRACSNELQFTRCDERLPENGAEKKTISPAAFRATVCKTVRPVLSDRYLSCLSVLSATLVYCGPTVGWIKMKLGTEVGLGPGHIVFDRDSA